MNSDNKTVEQFIYEESVKEKERIRINLEHIQNGVTFIDWKNTYIDPEVKIGEGTILYPGTVLQGNTSIGKNCMIRQNCRIQDSVLGDGVEAENSVIVESKVERQAKIGPFAYLRPGSNIGECAKVGDFVEVKNSTLGSHSKASHLTYIGDSDVGEHVNLGCGVVFVNYDGTNKHRSTIGDGAFIGCNTNVVSPVNVGKDAYVAAGTTLTNDVPEGALAVGRAKQRNIEGWTAKRGLLKKKDKR